MTIKILNTKKSQLICVAIGVVLFGILGFFLGRKTVEKFEPTVEIVYVPGETVHDSIPYPEPYEIIKPADTADIIKACVRDGIYTELFPERVITEYIEITKEDTAEIIRDWGTKRLYSETIFDVDTLGKCVVDASVQYNRLTMLSYSYTPVIKTITITENRVRFFSPFMGFGLLVDNDFSVYTNVTPMFNMGFFFKEKYGLHLQYGRKFYSQRNMYNVSFLYKF